MPSSCGMSQGTELRSEFFSPLPRQDPHFPIVSRTQELFSVSGLVFMPGTIQLTRKDILYRLQASKAKCIVASEEVAPAVDSIVSECPHLKTKLLVSPHCWDGWLSFQELLQWVCEVGGARHHRNHSSISESAYPVTQQYLELIWVSSPLCITCMQCP